MFDKDDFKISLFGLAICLFICLTNITLDTFADENPYADAYAFPLSDFANYAGHEIRAVFEETFYTVEDCVKAGLHSFTGCAESAIDSLAAIASSGASAGSDLLNDIYYNYIDNTITFGDEFFSKAAKELDLIFKSSSSAAPDYQGNFYSLPFTSSAFFQDFLVGALDTGNYPTEFSYPAFICAVGRYKYNSSVRYACLTLSNNPVTLASYRTDTHARFYTWSCSDLYYNYYYCSNSSGLALSDNYTGNKLSNLTVFNSLDDLLIAFYGNDWVTDTGSSWNGSGYYSKLPDHNVTITKNTFNKLLTPSIPTLVYKTLGDNIPDTDFDDMPNNQVIVINNSEDGVIPTYVPKVGYSYDVGLPELEAPDYIPSAGSNFIQSVYEALPTGIVLLITISFGVSIAIKFLT